MRSKFVNGLIAGSVIGMTAAMYASSQMTPRQRKRMVKRGKKLLINVIDHMDVL